MTSKMGQRVLMDIADDWVLHHDNVRAHTVLSIREFLAKKNIPVLPHPPCSPDLAPCDFYLFPKLKSKLKGHHFGTVVNVKKIVTDELHALNGKWLPVLLWSVEKMLEPLCNFPRVILLRRYLVISGESNRHLNKKSVHLLFGQLLCKSCNQLSLVKILVTDDTYLILGLFSSSAKLSWFPDCL